LPYRSHPAIADHPKGMSIMTTKSAEMTTKDFAAAIGTDPKTLRKFLRDSTPRDQHPGKGSRWVLPGSKTAISTARRAFAKWQKEQADAAADRAAKAAKDATDALTEVEGLDEDAIETDEEVDQEVTETE
jgi:predicted transcriptional regulator